MTITGLDISIYQEQPIYDKYIDWSVLKNNNPDYNFRFIWIKCSEGEILPTESGAYPVLDVKRQVEGAKSVGFEAINLYHFYYWRLPTAYNSDGSVKSWYYMDNARQVESFYQSYLLSGCDIKHPMTDLEDYYIGASFQWSDTASANTAISLARKLNNHLKDYHEKITARFGVKPDIYTGKWWWSKFGDLLLANYPLECAWWKDYKFVLADYTPDLDYIIGIPKENVIAWQKTSTPNPWVKGIPTGMQGPGSNLDIDQWMLSDAEFNTWCGKGVSNMANIYKKSTPMADRAWVMEVKPNQKVNAGISTLGVDAVILPMVNTPWNGSHLEILPEPTFAGRFAESGNMPVFGKITVDAGFVTTEQHTQPEFDGHTIWQNLYLRQILTAWHIGPWSQDNLKPADFRQIKGLIIEQTSERDHRTPSSPIADFWQAYMFKYVTDKLRVLMGANAIPNIPIILKTTPAWLQKYPNDFAIMLSNQERKNWLYLMLSDPKLESTSIMPDLWSIFKYAPDDTYKYPYVPDGYEDRVVLYEFTAGKQQMAFASGTAYLSKAFDNATEFAKWMGGTGVSVKPPPPDPIPVPIPVPTDIEARLLLVEEKVKKIEDYLKSFK